MPQVKEEKKYTLEEMKEAFFKAFHKSGKVTFPYPTDDFEGNPTSVDEDYCWAVTNSRWELIVDGLLQEEIKGSDKAPVFVFGSNLKGAHGRGAALFAKRNRGAVYGQGVGHHGNSYAIPTKDEFIKTLPLSRIETYVQEFIYYARENPGMMFEITRIGCGLAGYKDEDIAPMFKGAPSNCIIPLGWQDIINKK